MKKWDLNTTDVAGNAAIGWAVRAQHGGIVKMLEREDVNLNTADESGQTPLLLAAEYGQKDIVKMLLERRDVTPDTADEMN